MNRSKTTFTIICFVLMLCGNVAAQNFSTPFQPCFSSAGAGTTHFNFEITDSIFYDLSAVHQVLLRDPTTSTWTTENMSLLYAACTTFTYSRETTFEPPSGQLEWYLRSEIDTAVVSQSPRNSANTFPPPEYLMADMGDDAVGDAVNPDGNFVDIVRCLAGYSDTKLYLRLDNNGGGFPLNSGLFTYYIYGVAIVDPDLTGSAGYAAIYANVLGLITTGLYRIDLADSSFTKVANISTNISGNSLNMSCNISDLTSQPGWSSWPPPSGFIGVAPVTITQNGTEMENNDIGKSGIFVPTSNLLDFTSNVAPALTGPDVTLLGDDTLLAQVTFTDSDNNLPVLRNFNCESVDYAMTACEKDYAAGTLFEYQLEVTESGWYRYYFHFSDGVETATTDVDSIYVDLSTYLPGDADGNGIVNISDVVFLVDYIFGGGPAPDPVEAGDADCNGIVNISDAVYLVEYIFGGGPAPCE